jgi:hypothetical protein
MLEAKVNFSLRQVAAQPTHFALCRQHKGEAID